MIWTPKSIADFIEIDVVLPGEELMAFDRRMMYETAIEYAQEQGEEGIPLLRALEAMATI